MKKYRVDYDNPGIGIIAKLVEADHFYSEDGVLYFYKQNTAVCAFFRPVMVVLEDA